MAYRQNIKRIDPRYFMDEKATEPLNEEAPHFSPLSATRPGERIPVPGSQRPYERRDIDGNVAALGVALAAADESFEELWQHRPSSAENRQEQRAFVTLKQALGRVHNTFAGLQRRIGEDPRATVREEE